jgi:protocatechuate 3,4-dioxygenase beta subunit
MDRKDFLKKLGVGAIAGVGVLSACDQDSPLVNNEEDCKLTGTDVLGPFFVAGTAQIVNLNSRNFPGTPMTMGGVIYSGEGTDTIIEGAKIEIWHADDGGAYHPEGSGDVSNYEPSEITLRGFVLSETDGTYAFQSIRPGLYGSRARHIHFKITAPGHEDLVTQSYFQGDNRLTEDFLAKKAGECRIIAYSDDGTAGIAGAMNFNLKQL